MTSEENEKGGGENEDLEQRTVLTLNILTMIGIHIQDYLCVASFLILDKG
jgi:hypothetical protein